MWIKRDFQAFLEHFKAENFQPVKVLKGPRQVGKTSVLEHLGHRKVIYLDDLHVRARAADNPKLFLDQYDGPIVLDEASLVPELFFELKRRVDSFKREQRQGAAAQSLDIWITGSNQTLLEKNVQESLAGRASYFDLNTLSWHELPKVKLRDILMRGGWPELHVNPQMSHVTYLNDLISTFIERDIVSAAGIERREAFTRSIGLLAARVGQLLNVADIAKNVGVDATTLWSWLSKLEQNALVRIVRPYYNNLNQRLIKTPKAYFEDVSLAVRFQGWTDFEPLYLSAQFGPLLENMALTELTRFFQNRGLRAEIFYLRSKEKDEVDFLVRLPNNQWVAVEVKASPTDYTDRQLKLLSSIDLNVVARWVTTPGAERAQLKNSLVVPFLELQTELANRMAL